MLAYIIGITNDNSVRENRKTVFFFKFSKVFTIKITSIIDIYEMFERKIDGPLSVPILNILQEWDLIAKNYTLK